MAEPILDIETGGGAAPYARLIVTLRPRSAHALAVLRVDGVESARWLILNSKAADIAATYADESDPTSCVEHDAFDNAVTACGDADMTARIKRQKNARANANRKERDAAMRSLGLVKVRGNLGGVYWE